MQIIINAGGSGSRLWPLSTSAVPKQFVAIIDQEPLLLKTYNRVSKDFSAENIWITTNSNHLEFVKNILPDFPVDHILTEPERRDTFAAVVAHAAVVASRTSVDEPIIFIHSDHNITPQSSVTVHNQALKTIEQSLLQNLFDIIVVGIKPTFPSPQYGYIEIAQQNSGKEFDQVVPVTNFKEKPDVQTAQSFLDAGNYLWNFGSFSFTFKKLLTILEQVLPESVHALNAIFDQKKIDLEHFRTLPKTSFDYAVLEKTKQLGMVGMKLDVWDDIGSFDTVYQYLPEIPQLSELDVNAEKSKKPLQIQVNGQGNKVKLSNPQRKVAFVGTQNLLVVETEEGLLIIDPNQAKEVKQISQYFE